MNVEEVQYTKMFCSKLGKYFHFVIHILMDQLHFMSMEEQIDNFSSMTEQLEDKLYNLM